MKLNFSRTTWILLGVLGFVAVVLLILAFVVFPPSPGGGGQVAQAPPARGPTRTPHPWSIATPHPWSITGPTAVAHDLAAPTQPPGQPTVPLAAQPSATPLPGGAGELPSTSSGLPWLIPIGVLMLIVVVWWRLRRTRATD